MKKLLMFAFFALALVFNQTALAQDQATTETSVTKEVTAADLDIKEPTTLPTNGFGYFFKNLGRAIQTTLTFNSEKKAQLQLDIANEKLLEAKKIAEQNPDNAKAQAVVEKSLQKYQEMMDKVQTRVQAIKEKNGERAEKLLDKIADNQLKQQQVMDEIEENTTGLTEEQKKKFEAIKEKTLEKFGEFLQKVEQNQEKMKERLEKAAESAGASTDNAQDKLNNLRVIQRLGDKMENEDMRQGLKEANQAIREKFFDQMSEEGAGAIKEFNVQLESLPGQSSDQLRVINFLKEGLTEQAKIDPALNALTTPLRKFEQNRLENLKMLLEETQTPQQQQELLQPLEDAGDTKSVEVIDRLRQEVKNVKAKEALQQVQERKVENINNRLEKMENEEDLQELRKEINSAPVMQRVIKQADPELLKRVEQRMGEMKKIEETRKAESIKNEANNNQATGRPAQGNVSPQVMPRKDNPSQNQGQGTVGQPGTNQAQRPLEPRERPEARQLNNLPAQRQIAPQEPQN